MRRWHSTSWYQHPYYLWSAFQLTILPCSFCCHNNFVFYWLIYSVASFLNDNAKVRQFSVSTKNTPYLIRKKSAKKPNYKRQQSQIVVFRAQEHSFIFSASMSLKK